MERIVSFAVLLVLTFAASGATVQIDPASSIFRSGEPFDLDVRITDVTDLYAYQFDIEFGPGLLQPVSVTEGGFLAAGGGTFFAPGNFDSGAITFTANTLLGPVPGVSGSGTLATIRFSPFFLGTRVITPTNVLLLNSALEEIPADVETGLVTIIPEANSGFLFGSVIGLYLVGARLRAKLVYSTRRAVNGSTFAALRAGM
jgi:hypothetical protein